VEPGNYTAIVIVNTGLLGGEIEGRLELTIE